MSILDNESSVLNSFSFWLYVKDGSDWRRLIPWNMISLFDLSMKFVLFMLIIGFEVKGFIMESRKIHGIIQ